MVSANEARSCDVVPGTPSGEEIPGAVLGDPVTGPGHDGVGLGVGLGDGEAVGVGAGAGAAAGAAAAVGLAAGADGAPAAVVVVVTVVFVAAVAGCGELAGVGVTLWEEDAATLALDFARFAARWLGTPCWVILPILLDLRLVDAA
jgi:hypothetical protein